MLNCLLVGLRLDLVLSWELPPCSSETKVCQPSLLFRTGALGLSSVRGSDRSEVSSRRAAGVIWVRSPRLWRRVGGPTLYMSGWRIWAQQVAVLRLFAVDARPCVHFGGPGVPRSLDTNADVAVFARRRRGCLEFFRVRPALEALEKRGCAVSVGVRRNG